MKIEIQGQGAINATEALLQIDGVQGSYQTLNAVEREGTLVTIATIVGIVSGSLTVAEKLYEWNKKYQRSLNNPGGAKIEKVLVVAEDGRRLLLQDATVEQIKDILES
jgi:hypothetical protein